MNSNRDNILTITKKLEDAEEALVLLKHALIGIRKHLSSFNSISNLNDSAGPSKRSLSESDSTADCSSSSKRLQYDFIIEDDRVVVYANGVCEYYGKGGVGVWFGNDHPLNVSKPVVGNVTTFVAVIQACVEAVNTAYRNGIRKLKVKTNSEYVYNAMTKWISNWKRYNWKAASTGEDVKQKEDFIILDNACQLLDVAWELVVGQGDLSNKEAEKLAKAGT